MIIRTPPKLTNRKAFIQYIEVNLWSWIRDLTTGLLNINFAENFQSFTVSNLSIPANTEITIPNQFLQTLPGIIPSSRIITKQQGDANIIDGMAPWTISHLSLRNPSANDAVITVIFLR